MSGWNGVDLTELTLTSARLTLRPWRRADADAVLAEVGGDPWMREFLPIPDPYTEADAVAFVSDIGHEGRFAGTGFGGAMVETTSGRVVGGFGLRLPTTRHARAEIGYSVYPGGRGHGYAAEASDTLARWAFGPGGLSRVEIYASVRNIASIKSALAAGFTYEGIGRQLLSARAWVDDGACFARLRGDSGEAIPPRLAPLPPGGLSDGVITLRVVERADAPMIMAEHNDPVSMSWAFDDKLADLASTQATSASAGLLWLVGPVGRLTIVDVATGTPAGSMQLRQAGPPRVGEIGYGVHPAFRGRGYTTRGLRLLSEWALGAAGFGRLELGAKEGNIASQKSALNAGFVAEGVMPGRLVNPDGTFSGEARFALTAEMTAARD